MYSLHYPRLWLGLGWSLVLAVILASLAPGGPGMHWLVNDKLLHASAYACLAFWFAGIYRKSRFARILLGLMLLGLLLELVQGTLRYRSFDYLDLLANAAGALLALGLAGLLPGSWCARLERRLVPAGGGDAGRR